MSTLSPQDQKLQERLRNVLLPLHACVKRPASGALSYDYLVPGGPYNEQWDWDGFFIGVALTEHIASEAIYLRNWCLNYLHHVDRTGFVPGLLTPKGRDMRLHHMKPFLAQGTLLASQRLHTISWVHPYFSKLKRAVLYREKHLWDKKMDLGVWHDGMESGADNNVAVLGHPNGSVVGADLNAFLWREYHAMSIIAELLHKKIDSQWFRCRAEQIRQNIERWLWDAHDGSYYNMDTRTRERIRRMTYSNCVPLWAGLTSRTNARTMIWRHMLNPRELWAPWGVRTLARNDAAYNQKNIIKPHSNWQGPAWPLVNALMTYALAHYGFQKEARLLARRTAKLCLRDIERSGGMHENYHAETGAPLAAPNFISWNLLTLGLLENVAARRNPFALK